MKKIIVCLIVFVFSVTGFNSFANCPPVMAGETGTAGQCRSVTILDVTQTWCDTGAEGPGDCMV